MLTQERVIETVKALPREFSLDDLFDKLIVIEKINKGMKQIANGEYMTTDELKENLNQWRVTK
jgi:predicted transcriptional regulator